MLTHTDRQTDRQTEDRQTDKQTDRQLSAALGVGSDSLTRCSDMAIAGGLRFVGILVCPLLTSPLSQMVCACINNNNCCGALYMIHCTSAVVLLPDTACMGASLHNKSCKV